MNCSIYFFGILSNGHTQYPNDYTQTVFQKFYGDSTSVSQIATHREGNLMYYAYIRKLDKDGTCFGICIVLNDVMFNNVADLFPLFEQAFVQMVVKGHVLKFADNGAIEPNIKELHEKQTELEHSMGFINGEVKKIAVSKLPAYSYDLSESEVKHFSIDDDAKTIASASAAYNYTYIHKSAEDADDAALSGYRSVISNLSREKNSFASRCNLFTEETGRATAAPLSEPIVMAENSQTGWGKAVAIVSYFTPIGWIIAAILHGIKKTGLGAFHLRYSGIIMLGLFIWGMISGMVLAGIESNYNSSDYIFMTVMNMLIAISSFVLWLIGLIAAIRGKKTESPLSVIQARINHGSRKKKN